MMTKLNSGQKHFLRLNDARLLLEQATDEIEQRVSPLPASGGSMAKETL